MTYLSIPYKIESIEPINEEVKLFKLKSKINPRPGQFLEVSIPGIGECPLASCSYNNKQIHFLTRKAGNTTTAMFQLQEKDTLNIRGPYGKGFPIEELRNKNLILIAGGTGIAPITSLINYVEQNIGEFKAITIYFGFRSPEYILLKENINKWKERFNVTVCLNEKPDSENKKGFVPDNLKEFNPENTIACMCGPEPMMKSVTEKLNQLGLTNDFIYWSLERRMECGIGNCNRCLIQDLYVCKDGPVFKYSQIKPRLDNEEKANEEK